MFKVIHFDSMQSSNDYVLTNTHLLENNTVIVAKMQTKGRGTHGKEWVSPIGNLYFSIYKQVYGQQSDLNYLSVNVGVKVAQTLFDLGVKDIGIKWPNDIFLNQKKIGGILIETKKNASLNGITNVVIGVGLNLVIDLNLPIEQPYSSLAASGYNFDKDKLLLKIIDNINLCTQLL